MFYNENIDAEKYIDFMEILKAENRRYIDYIFGSLDFRLRQAKNEFRNGNVDNIFRGIRKVYKRTFENGESICQKKNSQRSNYFSNHRIAIYTCITGNYDTPREPLFCADNCDYYYISEQNNCISGTKWEYIDISKVKEIKLLSAKDKNRYLKMHPEILFKEYDYSIYIDGNIKIITDPTEFIQNISKYGIATFRHPTTDCVYKEGENCIKTHKAADNEIRKHLNYMERNGMPYHYGLAYCGMLVREHNNPICCRIMNEWWEMYSRFSKRDQISFPYVLYKHNININEVVILGDNQYQNYAIRILPHFMSD